MRDLDLKEIRGICDEILRHYNVSFSDYQEERKDGEVKFVHLTLKFIVSNRNLRKASSRSLNYVDSKE